MKRIGNLFDKICTLDNFKLAYKNATKGKKHYKEVKYLETIDLDEYLNDLMMQVQTHQYKTSKYEIFELKTGGKVREIYKLPMRDRIVQHAIMNIIEPIFRRSFITDTYSSIKGRGLHKCLHKLKKALKDVEGTKYCLKLDIHKFYPSIKHEQMKKAIRRKFKDVDLLQTLDEIIDSTDKGVPIGNYTSQYFANYILNRLDHYIKEQSCIKYYFRYCDDMVLLSNTKLKLTDMLSYIIYSLSELELCLKPNWQIFPIDSRMIDFVGCCANHTNIKVRKNIKINFRDTFQKQRVSFQIFYVIVK